MLKFEIKFPPVNSRQDPQLVDDAVKKGAFLLRNAVRRLTPKKSGETRLGWRVARQARAFYRVFNDNPKARWLEYGTGRYGPVGQDIHIVRSGGIVEITPGRENYLSRALRGSGIPSGGKTGRPALRFPGGGIGYTGEVMIGGFPYDLGSRSQQASEGLGWQYAAEVHVKGIKPRGYFELAKAETSFDIKTLIAQAAYEEISIALFGISASGRKYYNVRGGNPKNIGQFSKFRI